MRAALAEAELYGVDINDGMIDQDRSECSRVQVSAGSVYALPFADRHFDVVLWHESFMHFEEPERALGELARVARCRLYVSITTRRQLNTLLRRAGLLPPSDVPHWTYNYEDIVPRLPTAFTWEARGAFLLGRKVLDMDHARHAHWHRLIGRRLPQWLLRRFGQTIFLHESQESW